MGLTRHQISCWIFLLALLSCACGQTSVKEILDRLRRVQNAQKSGLMQRIASTDAKIWDFLKNEALVLGTTESTPQSSTEGSDTTAKPYFNLSSTVPPSSASSECLASALMLLNGLIQGHSWAVQSEYRTWASCHILIYLIYTTNSKYLGLLTMFSILMTCQACIGRNTFLVECVTFSVGCLWEASKWSFGWGTVLAWALHQMQTGGSGHCWGGKPGLWSTVLHGFSL